MNITRNGKIARLPLAVRQELNRRLQDGEQGKKLVPWLNALPEVRAILTAEFGGKRIREQNLSEWKRGGYREWLLKQDALEVAERLGEDAAEWKAEGRSPLTETLALWVAGRYAAATRKMAAADSTKGWRQLREMCCDIVELRRGDHSAQRLELERVRIATAQADAQLKWRRKIVVGLEALAKFAEEHPEAKAAMAELTRLVRHPFDPDEIDTGESG